ncbi:glutamate--tRNA ligase [Aurantimonas sp. VKM B-3413]|uniref:glutamate--tRNA ligase n=1 Tax=Aurantimonas sp. VKM B-3413 TaxID=2779401 RepID=UPI001E4F22BD|nr:glutamate--tRNA ligase [Aurantimonas sp. VKM B-3413]MCB8837484.1 glutamate--tRNA ligase [Aurantimonas sp. VKM B-3413]
MTVTVRFAPSPTGQIHIGNLRTALLNWLYAKRDAGGRFVLRFDDTDAERSRREYADGIEADLAWIGIAPDQVVRQSDRVALYDAAAERLKAEGLLYPCYETPDELDRRRKRLAARGLPPVYGREALRLTDDEKMSVEAEGRRPHWRFLLPNFAGDPFAPQRTEITWNDILRGPQTVDLASLSDPVLIREDGSYLYTLPSIVDDGDLGVSHIIRGDDHVTNTGVQIAIFRALGLTVPTFGHHNLLTTVSGEGLSKRSGALSLKTLREEGYEPMALASLAGLVGMPGSIDAMPNLEALGDRLEFGEASTTASRFDPAELDRLNADLVHAMPFEAARDRLAEVGVPGDEAEPFWAAVRGNCAKVGDARLWAGVVFADAFDRAELSDDDRAFLRAARDLFPDGPVGEATWRDWTGRLKTETGRKGKGLFMPLRLALTGRDHGPELAALLPLMGRERVLARLA